MPQSTHIALTTTGGLDGGLAGEGLGEALAVGAGFDEPHDREDAE
jgi:hypothetical protein